MMQYQQLRQYCELIGIFELRKKFQEVITRSSSFAIFWRPSTTNCAFTLANFKVNLVKFPEISSTRLRMRPDKLSWTLE